MNGQLRVSSKIKRMSSLVVRACSPMDQELKGSLSYMRPFIKKKRSRRRNVHLIHPRGRQDRQSPVSFNISSRMKKSLIGE